VCGALSLLFHQREVVEIDGEDELAHVMQKAGMDPSYMIGADIPQLGGGSIINFASAYAHVSLSGGALAHCATKGGVLAMTRQLASEGAPHHIRANTISPALIVTSHTKERLDHEPASGRWR
jgi:NAD(P)-dependent dehydrogenase (short-subunit alcohol dehydrogenase family)